MTETPSKTAIHSVFGADPEMVELVEMFVEEMPDRIAAMIQALESGDMDSLNRTAHQMKGAVGSYGFDQLTPCAATVEEFVRDRKPDEQIRLAVQELIELCQRVRSGQPG